MTWTHLENPAPTLARWLDRRLTATGALAHMALHGITLIDVADLADPNGTGARSSLITGVDLDDLLLHGTCAEAAGFDALALVRTLWLPTPDRPSRPSIDGHRFTGRRRGRAVAVVGDEGTGCVVRYDDDPACPITVGGPGVAGLVLPLVSLWVRSTDSRR